MKKRRLRMNMILIVLLCVVMVVMFYCLFDIYKTVKSSGMKEVEVLDKIEGYEYQLDENDSPYFESLFKELKKILTQESIDEAAYAEQIAKLFVTDFYSLKYASSKNDVGGVQFVYKNYQDSFIRKAKDSIYKYVENNLYGKRTQELPVVKEVTITSTEQDSYSFTDDIEDENAYVVQVEIIYEEDLDYPTECTLVLIHSGNTLEIASME